MFLIMMLMLMVSNVCFTFDFFGDSKVVAQVIQARQHEIKISGHFQSAATHDALHDHELMQQLGYITSFVSATSALSGFCATRLCATNQRLKNTVNNCCKAAIVATACVGAYAGYQIPMEVWQSTGDAEKMLYAIVLSDIGSACVGAVIGTLSS